jgi:FAD/FMN-containing dehydrogenase
VDLEKYGQDWSQLLTPNPSLVFFPKSTDEVSQFLAYCFENSVAVVPSGGRTGLSGGAMATNQEVVLSLEKMNQIGEVDLLGHTLWVQAGAVTESVHEHCRHFDLTWPVDFASKGSSQVGGNISTNAGGIRVIRFGSTRNWVLGLKVVLASGQVLDMLSPLEKNNTGLDLKQLFIGSEGILGVITEAVLKLAPLDKQAHLVMFQLDSFKSVMSLFQISRTLSLNLNAFEVMSDNCFERSIEHFGLPQVFSNSQAASKTSVYVLAELNGDKEFDEIELQKLMNCSGLIDSVLAQNSEDASRFWKIREGVAEAIMSDFQVHQQDISVPVGQLEKFTETLENVYADYFRSLDNVFIFGHIGDGNLHIFIRKPKDEAANEFLDLCHQFDSKLFQFIENFKGSVSAEHGIGLLKKQALSYTKSKAEIAILIDLKKNLDPKNILNPSKILD